MGVYTEFSFKCTIKNDRVEKLQQLIDNDWNWSTNPDFKLMEHAPRKESFTNGDLITEYAGNTKIRSVFIFNQIEIKNYDRDIEIFLECLFPYIDEILELKEIVDNYYCYYQLKYGTETTSKIIVTSSTKKELIEYFDLKVNLNA